MTGTPKPKASGAFYRSLFDNMLDGLAYCQMIFDTERRPVDFVFVEVNKNYEQLTGMRDVVGKKVTDLIPGIRTASPEMFEAYGRVAATGMPERLELYVAPLSRWFLISVYSPKKGYFTAVFQNITDRKRAERDLINAKVAARNVLEDLGVEKSKVETARAKEEAILLSIGDGLLAADEKGDIMLINAAAERLLGTKASDVMGKPFSELILEDEHGAPVVPERHPVQMALRTRATTATTTAGPAYQYVRKDGTRFPVAITVTPVMLLGKAVGAIEVFRDITREKEIDKAKSEFVSLASHQLRTPTTAIGWYCEMLLEGDVGRLNEKQRAYLEEVHHGNSRMIDLVNTLLSVSRIELGTFAMEQGPVNVAGIADDVVKELQVQIEEKELKVERNYEAGLRGIESDCNLIRIILQNLLSNAVEYTPAKGRISITIGGTGTGIRIEVRDSGCGIPERAQEKIYTKFFRADNARALKSNGTGLGLYIAKSMVEALGGTIGFVSREGEGTTFSVIIPGRGVMKRLKK